jgi:putative flippase GtrA
MPVSYMLGSLLSSILNITVSFLGYKWFVFKTRGNYLREWVRCLMVYSGSIFLGLALLPPTVLAVSYITTRPAAAPYIAGALVLGVQVVLSFLGHKHFSFRSDGRVGE